ncbi:hypothetical protein [Burkholderia ubonensis]|uniref:hypothetical protein n=1 Tax=Burkholderia ubonensis TaxID=101571 RepID=UPI0015CA8E58|nr:hypothetical protein [Burkholderia ubonensis]
MSACDRRRQAIETIDTIDTIDTIETPPSDSRRSNPWAPAGAGPLLAVFIPLPTTS